MEGHRVPRIINYTFKTKSENRELRNAGFVNLDGYSFEIKDASAEQPSRMHIISAGIKESGRYQLYDGFVCLVPAGTNEVWVSAIPSEKIDKRLINKLCPHNESKNLDLIPREIIENPLFIFLLERFYNSYSDCKGRYRPADETGLSQPREIQAGLIRKIFNFF